MGEAHELIRRADAYLERGRTAEERRREKITVAARLREQAEQPENGLRREALLVTADGLERSAGRPPLRRA